MNRLFVAVRPPTPVIEALAELPVRSIDGMRLVPPSQLHVTLKFLGDAEPTEVIDAMEGFDPAGAVARLGPRVTRLGRDALVVPVTGLDDLAREVAALTLGLGDQPEGRPFRGHITMARLRRRTEPPRHWDPVEMEFPVEEVELISSTLTESGAVHRTAARWPTRPHPQP